MNQGYRCRGRGSIGVQTDTGEVEASEDIPHPPIMERKIFGFGRGRNRSTQVSAKIRITQPGRQEQDTEEEKTPKEKQPEENLTSASNVCSINENDSQQNDEPLLPETEGNKSEEMNVQKTTEGPTLQESLEAVPKVEDAFGLIRLDEPVEVENEVEEYQIKDLRHCPYRKYGCDNLSTPYSVELGEHVRRKCPFRYSIRCFVPGCDNEIYPVFVGFFQNHLIDLHQSTVINMRFNCSDSQEIYLDLPSLSTITDETFVPHVFVSYEKPGLMFPLVMKKINDYIYIWMYQITDRDVKKDYCIGRLRITPRFIPAPTENAAPLTMQDVIHHVSEPVEEIIKSRRLISVPFYNFAETYISNFRETCSFGRETENYFYHLQFVIFTGIEDESSVLLRRQAQQDLEEEARLLRDEGHRNNAQKKLEEEARLAELEEDRIKSKKYAASLISLPFSIENVALQRRRNGNKKS